MEGDKETLMWISNIQKGKYFSHDELHETQVKYNKLLQNKKV